MSIEWLRDLFIIIFAIAAIGTLIFFALLIYSVYKRSKSTLYAVENTTVSVQNISFLVQEQLTGNAPILQAITVLRGVREGVDIFNKIFRKK